MRFKDNSRLRTRSQARLESRYWILVRIRVRGPPPRAGTSARTRDRDQPGSFLASRAARSCFKCLPMSSDPVPAFIFLTQTRALPPGPGRRTAAARACQHHESYAPAGARPRGRPVTWSPTHRHCGNSGGRDRQSDSDPLFSWRQCAVITVVMPVP